MTSILLNGPILVNLLGIYMSKIIKRQVYRNLLFFMLDLKIITPPTGAKALIDLGSNIKYDDLLPLIENYNK
jgi:hypothetical protein